MNPPTNTFQSASLPRPPIPVPPMQGGAPFPGSHGQNPSSQSFHQQQPPPQQQPLQFGPPQGQQQQSAPMLQPPQSQSFSSIPTFQRPVAPPPPSQPPHPSLKSPSQQTHDAQFDYFGKRLATCSSDRTIRLWQLDANGQTSFLTSLSGHEGPVWQVSWGHPKYGSVLASAGFDGKVLVWKEVRPQQWIIAKTHAIHEASINAVQWAPEQYGPLLACASSDGKVSILRAGIANQGGNEEWTHQVFTAHQMGVLCLSWAPLDESKHGGESGPRLATGGSDNAVKIWSRNEEGDWTLEQTLTAHTDWVRDVAWAPRKRLLASCSQDNQVLLWSPSSPQERDGNWTPKTLSPAPFPDTVWRVSWSVESGDLLAVSCGDNQVTLWTETEGGTWECVSKVPSGTDGAK